MKKRPEILRMKWIVILIFALLVLGIMGAIELNSVVRLEPEIGASSCDNLPVEDKCGCLDSVEKNMRESINREDVCGSGSKCDNLKALVNEWTNLLEEINVQCGYKSII